MPTSASHAPSSGAFDPGAVRIVATIEARMTSSRLPGKVLMDVEPGVSVLELLVTRLRRAQTLSGICVATTDNATDDPIEELAGHLGIDCHRGSEDDVLGRVVGAAQQAGADVIVETLADCPLLDPVLVDACVAAYFAGDVHYAANIGASQFPIGLAVQVFATDVLAEVAATTDDPADREHVSLYIYEHPETYRLGWVPAVGALHRPEVRLTVDTEDDLALIRAVVGGAGAGASTLDVLAWLDEHPDVAGRNRHVTQKPVR